MTKEKKEPPNVISKALKEHIRKVVESSRMKLLTGLHDQNTFKQSALEAIISFQVLESLLSNYLATCYTITTIKLRGYLDFNPQEDFQKENNSLGSLIKSFKRYVNDEKLIKELDKLRKERNIVVHESLLLLQRDTEQLKDLPEHTKSIEATHTHLKTVLVKVDKHLVRVEGVKEKLSQELKSSRKKLK